MAKHLLAQKTVQPSRGGGRGGREVGRGRDSGRKRRKGKELEPGETVVGRSEVSTVFPHMKVCSLAQVSLSSFRCQWYYPHSVDPITYVHHPSPYFLQRSKSSFKQLFLVSIMINLFL